jgi:hypothetical protein
MTPVVTLEDSNSRYRFPETDHPFLNMNCHNINKLVMLPPILDFGWGILNLKKKAIPVCTQPDKR